MKKYTIKHFITKFRKIPENKWTTKVYEDNFGRRCALGHCRIREEGKSLLNLFKTYDLEVPEVNDSFLEFGNFPKERILVALENIKYLQS